MNADGSGVTRLTNNPTADGHPSWSPDSTQIAFETNRDGNYEIYLTNADGSNPKRLTVNTVQDRRPYWCPSCIDRIAFMSNRDGVNLVYVMAVLDLSQSRLTTQLPGSTGQDDSPAWSGLPIRLPAPLPLSALPVATPTR
jgi:Tol biopolymer transport system component